MNISSCWSPLRSLALSLVASLSSSFAVAAPIPEGQYFEIQLVDAETGRGIPLAELVTPNHMRYLTDSAGRVAFHEPGLMGQTIFFDLKTHGYEVPKDGFGISGIRFETPPGGSKVVKLKRKNLAERLYRTTGYGIYRDSVILGKETPVKQPLGGGMVAGQDSVMGVPYRGKLQWFWGDTSRMSYPLGLFRMGGATSEMPGKGGLPPEKGIDFKYFTGKDGFCRAMVEVPNPEGVVWIFGVATVPDETGRERLVGHYSRRKGLGEEYEHGMVVYNDEREIFEVKATLPLEEKWRFLDAQVTRVKVEGKDYLYSGGPFLSVRVPATLADVLDPKKYEALTCAVEGKNEPDLGEGGAPKWRWQSAMKPTRHGDEVNWIKAGKLRAEHVRLLPEDSEKAGRRVRFHSGSVRWNAHRQRWVAIAMEDAYHEKNYPSALGEVWYSESESPDGPFRKAVRIATHEKQTFYNPCHHPFFDENGGRVIYFEGTYTNQFVGSPATPLYEYNQMMYRLDLDHPKLREAFPR